ncbi:MAG: phage tail-like protein [Flavobacteriales bacterium]|jgi:phage tail-like protein
MKDGTWYPVTGFYFKVEVDGISDAVDNSFKEVEGLSMEMELEEFKEGGNNQLLQVPKRMKKKNLVLKRGLVPAQSKLMTWVEKTVSSDLSSPITLKTILVKLLNEKGNPLLVWTFNNAYPIKYDLSNLDAMKNDCLVETMEFSYTNFSRKYAS